MGVPARQRLMGGAPRGSTSKNKKYSLEHCQNVFTRTTMSVSKAKNHLSEAFPRLVLTFQAAFRTKKVVSTLPLRPFGPGQHREIQLELEFPRRR